MSSELFSHGKWCEQVIAAPLWGRMLIKSKKKFGCLLRRIPNRVAGVICWVMEVESRRYSRAGVGQLLLRPPQPDQSPENPLQLPWYDPPRVLEMSSASSLFRHRFLAFISSSVHSIR